MSSHSWLVLCTVCLLLSTQSCALCVCSCIWAVLGTQCAWISGQSWAFCVLLYLASPVHSVCSYTWPVLSMLCVHTLGQSCALCVFSFHFISFLYTLCLLLSCQSCALCVFSDLASPVHSVCSYTCPVLSTWCLHILLQPCSLCVCYNTWSVLSSVCDQSGIQCHAPAVLEWFARLNTYQVWYGVQSWAFSIMEWYPGNKDEKVIDRWKLEYGVCSKRHPIQYGRRVLHTQKAM